VKGRCCVCALLAVAGSELLAFPAAADDPTQARVVYDRGTAAHRRGDFAEAAADFALADSLAPSPVALRAALDDAIKADDPALGMELVERFDRAPAAGPVAASASAAREKFQGRAGRVAVHCPASGSCMATLDGRTLDVTRPAWASVGQHTLLVQIDETPRPRLIEVKPNETLDVTPTPAPSPAPALEPTPAPAPASAPAAALTPALAPPAPVDRGSSGLSPVWFWVGLGATAIAGGATLWSGLDTDSKHQSFESENCPRVGSTSCSSLGVAGSSAETRTNVLVGVTAAVGAATVVALIFTRWGSHTQRQGRVRVDPTVGVFEF
jgi:hypothetical protein